jgi:hypothetical protein
MRKLAVLPDFVANLVGNFVGYRNQLSVTL